MKSKGKIASGKAVSFVVIDNDTIIEDFTKKSVL